MILGKMKQCGAQANAARCISHRSTLQRASQRTAFVASFFCRARCIGYTKTIHPARCIRPFTFGRPRSSFAEIRKRLKRERHCIARPPQKPIGMECPQTLGDGGRSIIPFPQACTPEAQTACIATYRKPQESSRLRASSPAKSLKKATGRMIGPEEPFWLVLGSQWHISSN